MIKKIVFIFFTILFLNAYNLNDAINAYKQHNYRKAAKIFELLINKNPQAINNLAMMYYYGEIKDKNGLYNQQKAVKLLKKGIKLYPNTSELYYNLGVIYFNGYVVTKNNLFKIVVKKKDALKYFKKAYILGYKKAKNFLTLYKIDNTKNKDINASKKK